MKIAMIIPGGVDRSGERRVIPALLALIERIARTHELHVYAWAQEPAPGRWELLGARIENIGARRTFVHTFAAVLAAVRREHRESRFDAVHSIWGGVVGLAGVTAAKLLGVRCAVHLAGGELVALPDIGYGGQLDPFGRVRESLVLRGATRVTAASRLLVDEIGGWGVTAQRVPLGVDLARWPPRAPRPRPPGEPARLVHVASLNPVKDQTTLLGALRRVVAGHPAVHVDVVGEDTLGGRIQMRAQALGLAGHVTFHGFRTQAQLRPIVEAAHVHVVSSRHEAGPLAVLEAAVAGVPTAGTAVGHVAEWANEAALATPPGDAAALATSIDALLRDDALRLRLAHQAQRRALEEDADFTAARFLEIYAALRT